MNESYTSFAQVYDMFMDNVNYPAWSKYLIQLLKEYQVEDGLVLDLGCGCLLYTSPSPRDRSLSRMPSSA